MGAIIILQAMLQEIIMGLHLWINLKLNLISVDDVAGVVNGVDRRVAPKEAVAVAVEDAVAVAVEDAVEDAAGCSDHLGAGTPSEESAYQWSCRCKVLFSSCSR
jgi:hypothetical protein